MTRLVSRRSSGLLAASHDVRKGGSVLPTVLAEHAPCSGYDAGEVIRDHDAALGYVLTHDADALPSYADLPPEERLPVRFTQADLGHLREEGCDIVEEREVCGFEPDDTCANPGGWCAVGPSCPDDSSLLYCGGRGCNARCTHSTGGTGQWPGQERRAHRAASAAADATGGCRRRKRPGADHDATRGAMASEEEAVRMRIQAKEFALKNMTKKYLSFANAIERAFHAMASSGSTEIAFW